jgi:hypothetical protein
VQRSAITFIATPPWMVPGLIVMCFARAGVAPSNGLIAARIRPMRTIAFMPAQGIEAWPLAPSVVTIICSTPFWPRHGLSSVGSPTITSSVSFRSPPATAASAPPMCVSSSVVKRMPKLPFSRSVDAAASIAAQPAFMSVVPRP